MLLPNQLIQVFCNAVMPRWMTLALDYTLIQRVSKSVSKENEIFSFSSSVCDISSMNNVLLRLKPSQEIMNTILELMIRTGKLAHVSFQLKRHSFPSRVLIGK